MNQQSSYRVYFRSDDISEEEKEKTQTPRIEQESQNLKTWFFSALNNSTKIPSTPAASVLRDLRQHQHMCAETFNSNMNGSDQFS
jgi:hypothetical protein